MTTGEKWGLAALASGAVLAVTGLVVLGVSRRRSRQLTGALGRARRPWIRGHVMRDGAELTHYYDPKMPIKQRVAILQQLVFESVKDPRMRKLALQITQGCPARDGDCEARAIDHWTRRRIRYSGDVAPIKMPGQHKPEGVDLFQSAYRTVEFGAGDCDDHFVLNATLLTLNGITARARITSGQRGLGDTWSHIYTIAGLPKNAPAKWIALDTTLPGDRYGQEAPFAKHVDFPA